MKTDQQEMDLKFLREAEKSVKSGGFIQTLAIETVDGGHWKFFRNRSDQVIARKENREAIRRDSK